MIKGEGAHVNHVSNKGEGKFMSLAEVEFKSSTMDKNNGRNTIKC